MRPWAISLLLVSAALPAAPATGESDRTTFLLSRTPTDGIPNGASRNAAVSHDQRRARFMAYESDASDIAPGDANNVTDVFLVKRAAPYSGHGTPWRIASTSIASTGLGGAPANGSSGRPALDGDSHHRPHCLAFVSSASNLVRGDTNGKADAFIKDVNSGRVQRVSVGSRGQQSNGETTEVQVDGACERVAFVAEATNLALKSTKREDWKSAVTHGGRPGVRQVYVRNLRPAGADRSFKGLTFLASASDFGKAGNGDSYDVAFARAGKALAYTSAASNLANARGTQVYERTFIRKFRHLGHGKGVQELSFDTRLVSAAGSGRPGNGVSRAPSISDQGRYVAFETLASNLIPGDANSYADIARADMGGRRPRQQWVSRSAFSGAANAESNRPAISDAGEFVLFDSVASNLKPSPAVADDPNGVRDLFLWNLRSRNVSLESRGPDNEYLGSVSAHPATSARGNYVAFEAYSPPGATQSPATPTSPAPTGTTQPPGAGTFVGCLLNLLVPTPCVGAARAKAKPAQAVAPSQVFVRYLGPK